MDEHTYPYDALKEELDRTSVISEKFRSLIISYAMAISQDSYERGRQFERGISLVATDRDPDLYEEFMSWLESKSINADSLSHRRQAELAGIWIKETS